MFNLFKDRDDKWTRERSVWEVHSGDLLMLLTALFFLVLTVGGIGLLVFQPQIRGLHELFSAPPPGPPADQKLHLAPGETEIKLYPGKPVAPPPPPKK